MKQDLTELVKELGAIPGYVRRLNKVFPKVGINGATIAKSIATFERSVVSKNAPYD